MVTGFFKRTAGEDNAMKKLLHPFFILLAHMVNSQLVEQVQYLKVENRILRSKLGKRVVLSPDERNRLIRFGKPLGPAIKDLISIVRYETFRNWVRGYVYLRKYDGGGRPETPAEIRDLILFMAKDNPGWGYKRILGELKKLDIQISRATIQKILRTHGMEPSPLRQDSTWKKFIKTHMDTLIACDFFTKEMWTLRGKVTVYVFFFIELGTRRVHLAGMTSAPKRAWVERRTKEVLDTMESSGFRPSHLIRDRDSKFSEAFDELMEDREISVVKTPVKNPSCNVYAERWVWSVKHECLNHFTVFGRHHLKYILDEYVRYYNRFRPHQGIGNIPIELPPALECPDSDIECENILGGFFHHYKRRAA
jgi:putative transposase